MDGNKGGCDGNGYIRKYESVFIRNVTKFSFVLGVKKNVRRKRQFGKDTACEGVSGVRECCLSNPKRWPERSYSTVEYLVALGSLYIHLF